MEKNFFDTYIKQILLVVLLAFFCFPAQGQTGEQTNIYFESLKAAYKDADLSFYEDSEGTYAFIEGEKILLQSRGKCMEFSPDAKTEPPLCSMFYFKYPVGSKGRYPVPGFNPGRVRNEVLLKKLYGDNQAEVKANCVRVNFLGKKLLFNKKHGAAAALARVSETLEQAIKTKPELKDYIFPLAGTFNWRTITASNRLSAHSFAITIDLNVEKGIYWLWDPLPSSKQIEMARKNYPQIIVDAFEAQGFIWGGKWHAFDFMHFEYRPEMFSYLKLKNDKK